MSEAFSRRPQRGRPRPPRESERSVETEPENWDEPADWDDDPPEEDETAAHDETVGQGETWSEEGEWHPAAAGRDVGDILRSPAVIAGAFVSVIAIVLIAVSMLLIAGENHYRSCVFAAQVKAGNSNAPLARLGRANEVQNCSHSPF